MTMSTRRFGCIPLEVNHLRPLSFQPPSTRSMRMATFVASEEATPGSVMQNAERISPANSGSSHRRRCSSVP